jgi:hypothetical protein
VEIIYIVIYIGRAAGQGISHRLSKRTARFESEPSNLAFVVDKATLGQVSSEYLGFPCQLFIPLIAP